MKNANTCPECRTRIDMKNCGIDLLAREIINEFEVFCPMEDCPWRVCQIIYLGNASRLEPSLRAGVHICEASPRKKEKQKRQKGAK